MNNYYPPSGFLEQTRLAGGMDGAKKLFRELAELDRQKAVQLVNDESLQFGTLFALRQEIGVSGLSHLLSPQKKSALEIANVLRTSGKIEKNSRSAICHDPSSQAVLRWILTSGCRDDGMSSDYERILELSAILLTRRFKDTSLLPLLVDMAFLRHRKGHLYYDLAWAFLEARQPGSLPLVARYLHSSDPSDVELACRLLSFVPCIDEHRNGDGIRLYSCTLQWLQENIPFLRHTGSAFQQTSHPKAYAVSLEAKYLCRTVSADTGKPVQAWTEDEQELLYRFGKMKPEVRNLLADYSYRLYCSNFNCWKLWLDCPVTEQKRLAEMKPGDFMK
jgi:hypothetical protein